MKKREIVASLKREAKLYTPDVTVDTGTALSPYEAKRGGEIALEKQGGKKKTVLIVAAALALLMFLAVLLPVLFLGGGSGVTTLVISINPSAEFTLEDGKVKSTKALNQDAAVMLFSENLIGMSAEDACVTFATLAQKRNLITANGIRILVTGKDHARISGSVQTALEGFSVSDLPDEDFSSIMGGYDETKMKDFEGFLSTSYDKSRGAFLAEAKRLLATYKADLDALDLGDLAAVNTFNQKYALLGDLCIELDDLDEGKAEYYEEYNELSWEIEHDPDEALEDLFDDFLEMFERDYDDYEHGGTNWRHDDDDDDDDDRWDRDDDDDDDRWDRDDDDDDDDHWDRDDDDD